MNAANGRIRLIIGDDQLLIREGIRELLATQNDFSVLAEAVDGREAVKLASKYQTDVLLLNWRLPKLQESRGSLLSLDCQRHTGIIFYGVRLKDFRLLQAVHSGAGGFLGMDSSSAEMFEAIRRAASGGYYIAASLQQ